MTNRSLSVYLIELIKALDISEKKKFRLFVKRNFKDRELKFLELFDFIDKTKNIDEEIIRQNVERKLEYLKKFRIE